jgi:pimeloyl-ACP methyl ester carboxylesterase
MGLRTLYVPAAIGHTAPERIVLLPGAFDAPEAFLTAGFDAAVQARALPLDLQFVALELAHVADRAMLEVLWRDVLQPARAAGCQQLWIGGISLGGFLALMLASQHPDAIDGLCLLAPYLGSRPVAREVGAAGAASLWLAGATLTAGDEDRELWRFVAEGLSGLPVWLGLARQDRFLDRHRLLAAELPATAVVTLDGGHDWPTWRKLWDNFLDTWTSKGNPTSAGPPRRS